MASTLPSSIGVGCLSPLLVDVCCLLCVVDDLAVAPSSLREDFFELNQFDPSALPCVCVCVCVYICVCVKFKGLLKLAMTI